MGKKCFFHSGQQAQITIFVIVGLVVLFMFLFMIQLSTTVRTSALQDEQEKIVTKAFKKEAIRIYVQDCLRDELEQGLLLLGRQGRIWKDQPGGTKAFEEGITGVTYDPAETLRDYSTGKIYYGISREAYSQYPRAYPCDTEENSPEFCQYQFPDTEVGFGVLNLRSNLLERDLKRYLTERTVACVQDFVASEISPQAKLESTDLELELKVENEGIGVKVDYPLRFSVGTEEFFHLSTFDFYYPTKFKQLVDAAVAFPMQWDQKYVDFSYTEADLQEYSFPYRSTVPGRDCVEEQVSGETRYRCTRSLSTDTYQALGIKMQREELSNGDDIFIFMPALQTIVNTPEPYSFRIARQNRPPALDYVGRSDCRNLTEDDYEYDYLVIKNDDEYKELDITLNAVDPDEEETEIKYGFSGIPFAEDRYWLSPDNKQLKVTRGLMNQNELGFYTLTAQADDLYGLYDKQEIRILVDNPLTTELSFENMPYTILNVNGEYKSYDQFFSSGDRVLFSREDPIFMTLGFADRRIDPALAQVTLSYKYSNNNNIESYGVPTPLQPECVKFPLDGIPCDINQYNTMDLENWEVNPLPTYKNPFTVDGELSFTNSMNYCGVDHASSSTKQIEIKECIPHINPEHLNPYIPGTDFYKEKVDVNGNSDGSEDINPFLSTHACCNSDWTLKEEGEGCFTDDSDPDIPVIYTCDGVRGNVCYPSE